MLFLKQPIVLIFRSRKPITADELTTTIWRNVRTIVILSVSCYKWYPFSGISMEIQAIVDGHVLPYILDPNFEKYLPIIPSEVSNLQFSSTHRKILKYSIFAYKGDKSHDF